MHLGVTLPGLVLGRRGGGDDRRINNRALAQKRATFSEQGVDLGEEAFGQVMTFEQVAELEQGRGIGNHVTADKGAHRAAVIKGILERLVGQRVPLLQEIHAQHPLDAQRRASSFRPWDKTARSAPPSAAHGTACSISERKRSRRVNFCLVGCSAMPAVYQTFAATDHN